MCKLQTREYEFSVLFPVTLPLLCSYCPNVLTKSASLCIRFKLLRECTLEFHCFFFFAGLVVQGSDMVFVTCGMGGGTGERGRDQIRENFLVTFLHYLNRIVFGLNITRQLCTVRLTLLFCLFPFALCILSTKLFADFYVRRGDFSFVCSVLFF